MSSLYKIVLVKIVPEKYYLEMDIQMGLSIQLIFLEVFCLTAKVELDMRRPHGAPLYNLTSTSNVCLSLLKEKDPIICLLQGAASLMVTAKLS